MCRATVVALLMLAAAPVQTIDWKSVESEAVKTLQGYVRINTSNPPALKETASR